MESSGFIFDLDPVAIDLGPVEIRYYGIVFGLTLFIAFLFWCWQMRRGGYGKDVVDSFLVYGVLGTLIGARLGHCLFYDWEDYSQEPLRILYFWEGGLSSHGATIGILLALYLYARRYKFRYFEMVDRFSFSAAIGAAGIRLGNFLNSEIVGRATTLPWGVRFIRHDHGEVLRHPSQLYEFTLGLVVLGLLLLVDRLAGGEKRPRGLLTGVFLSAYFLLRFCVEFVKDYQTSILHETQGLTMGQYLSIIPFLLGLALVLSSLRARNSSSGNGLSP